MIALLIIFGLMLAGGAAFILTVQYYNRALPQPKAQPELPPVPAGLFDDQNPEAQADPRHEQAATQRASLIARAAQRDLAALAEAHATGDVNLYSEILNAMIDACSRQNELATLVTHIAKSNELRANTRLAEQVMETWKQTPDQRSTVQMLHVAALSDDVETYGKAIDLALRMWRTGQLAEVKPQALLALIESQYWELAPEARRGGAAFALKRQLAYARRELTAATPR